jgi:CDP-diacylglycerol--glycerol-3-phosphate 3-phosphatidyltransferase
METIEERVNCYVRENVNDKVGSFLSITFPNISANKWTTIGFLASIAAAFVVVKCGLSWGALAIAISSSFDLFDGAVARARNEESRFGAFLDDIADRIGEIFYFSAIFWLNSSFAVFFAGITSVLVSYFNASAKARGFKPSSGTVTGRPGRIILLFLLMLLSPWFPVSKTLWLIVFLNIFTLVKRGLEVRKQNVV